MHKSDYLAQVEALRASPELRARVAGLAGTPARRRRLRPWMGVCACLAVLLLGGTLLLPRLGGSSAGGGGHAGGSIFQSYAGPVFPLTTLEDAGLTARRTITLDFAPWGDGHTTDIDVTDSYVLTNPTDTDQSVTLVYPFSGSFYALYPPTLTADGAALDAVIRPGVGGSQSLESWEEYAALVEGNDLAAAHAEIPALDTPVTVYAFTDLTRPESDAAAPTLAVTYPWSEDAPAVLTYGFHGSSIDREAGWARHSFSLPEPDSPHAQDPRLLIAVGGALEDYTLQGYRDGGCDPGGENRVLLPFTLPGWLTPLCGVSHPGGGIFAPTVFQTDNEAQRAGHLFASAFSPYGQRRCAALPVLKFLLRPNTTDALRRAAA